MKKLILSCLAAAVALGGAAAGPADPASLKPAPEFPTKDAAAWINSPPLEMSGLRGKVVLLDVWTFG